MGDGNNDHTGGGPERHVLARRSGGRPSLSPAGGSANVTRGVGLAVDNDEDDRFRILFAPKLTCLVRRRRVEPEELLPCLLPRLWSSRCRCALVPGAKVPSSDLEAAPVPSLSIVCSTAAMRSPKRTCVDDDVVVCRRDRCTYSKVAGKSSAFFFEIMA